MVCQHGWLVNISRDYRMAMGLHRAGPFKFFLIVSFEKLFALFLRYLCLFCLHYNFLKHNVNYNTYEVSLLIGSWNLVERVKTLYNFTVTYGAEPYNEPSRVNPWITALQRNVYISYCCSRTMLTDIPISFLWYFLSHHSDWTIQNIDCSTLILLVSKLCESLTTVTACSSRHPGSVCKNTRYFSYATRALSWQVCLDAECTAPPRRLTRTVQNME